MPAIRDNPFVCIKGPISPYSLVPPTLLPPLPLYDDIDESNDPPSFREVDSESPQQIGIIKSTIPLPLPIFIAATESERRDQQNPPPAYTQELYNRNSTDTLTTLDGMPREEEEMIDNSKRKKKKRVLKSTE